MTRTRALVASLGMTVGVLTGYLLVANSAPEPTHGSRSVTVNLECEEEDTCYWTYDGTTNLWTLHHP